MVDEEIPRNQLTIHPQARLLSMKGAYMNNLPELLAPAGSFASLEAAIEGGADAVYLGSSKFNARMRAGNFDDEELTSALRLCHAYGVKSYITMNIRLFDREISEALDLAKRLYEDGASALILADNGLAAEIKRNIPDFEIHASTQLSGHTVSDAKALMEAGFSRMVCPREITRNGLDTLCKDSHIEIEMFVHGAYCVSFSGQCIMSAVMGGRSGNRGSCAQPCRQPYTLDGKKCYPVSLKDMCLAGSIEDILRSGVASLKLEGRQKPAEYVYGVTKTYRRLLDERRNATEDEIAYLASLFSRQGFSDGYYKSAPRNMLGVRTMEEFEASDKSVFQGLNRKVKAEVIATATVGEPLRYTMTTKYGEVTVDGDVVNAADTVKSMSEEDAEKCAAKLGGTPFILNSFTYNCAEDAFVSRSMLNRARREAAEKLCDPSRIPPDTQPEYIPPESAKNNTVVYTAEFSHECQIPDTAQGFFSEIFLPAGRHGSHTPILPPVRFDEQRDIYPKDGRVMTNTTGQLYEAKKRGLSAVCSHRLNVFNSKTAEVARDMGAEFSILSPELTAAQIRDIHAENKSAIVYGRIPLMTLCRCAISDGGKNCKRGGGGIIGKKSDSFCQSEIKDRKGVTFPIISLPDCTNIVYNSVPIYMADKQEELDRMGITHRHFVFTTETKEECREIIRRYMKKLPAPENMSFTRIK